MFTGIIEEVGTITELTTEATGGHVRIEAKKVLPKLAVGSSVAVSGCCLTVVSLDESGFWCDLSPETLTRTGFRRLRVGSQVNLEASLQLDSPLGGHIVQGHVDAVGTFVGLTLAGEENYWLDVDVAPDVAPYLVQKGSVAVEGISLTVAAIEGARLRIAIIPFTYEVTNLSTLQAGDSVNLECDVLAKYLERLVQERMPASSDRSKQRAQSKLTLERLREEGF